MSPGRGSVMVAERRFQINLEVGKHLMLLGNLATGALVFGQAISGMKFDFKLAIVGLLTLAILYGWAWVVMKGGGE